MLGTLSTAFFWIKGNVKWIAIGAAVIAIAFGAWRYTNLVSAYAVAQNTISQLAQTIENKDQVIAIERGLRQESEAALEQQIAKTEQLKDRLKDIIANLPSDASEPAPDSLKETIRRLLEQENNQ